MEGGADDSTTRSPKHDMKQEEEFKAYASRMRHLTTRIRMERRGEMDACRAAETTRHETEMEHNYKREKEKWKPCRRTRIKSLLSRLTTQRLA